MTRRTMVQSMSAIAAGIALFPGCGDGLHLDYLAENEISFNKNQSIWIEAMSEAILPKGGRTLTTYETLPQFVSKMMSFDNSTDEQEQTQFYSGYNLCTEDIKTLFEASTKNLTPEQIISYFDGQLKPKEDGPISTDVVKVDEQRDKTFFCQRLRRLAITHLRTSKEYQEEVLEYKLVPGSYQACVTV